MFVSPSPWPELRVAGVRFLGIYRGLGNYLHYVGGS